MCLMPTDLNLTFKKAHGVCHRMVTRNNTLYIDNHELRLFGHTACSNSERKTKLDCLAIASFYTYNTQSIVRTLIHITVYLYALLYVLTAYVALATFRSRIIS